jgi:hypothetical protein
VRTGEGRGGCARTADAREPNIRWGMRLSIWLTAVLVGVEYGERSRGATQGATQCVLPGAVFDLVAFQQHSGRVLRFCTALVRWHAPTFLPGAATFPKVS